MELEQVDLLLVAREVVLGGDEVHAELAVGRDLPDLDDAIAAGRRQQRLLPRVKVKVQQLLARRCVSVAPGRPS